MCLSEFYLKVSDYKLAAIIRRSATTANVWYPTNKEVFIEIS